MVRFTSFQFHKGTIRTYPQSIYKLPEPNFNSIKVQLELLLAWLDANIISDFNSIKVQLELTSYWSRHTWATNFNSIKVQLELQKPYL